MPISSFSLQIFSKPFLEQLKLLPPAFGKSSKGSNEYAIRLSIVNSLICAVFQEQVEHASWQNLPHHSENVGLFLRRKEQAM